MAKTKQYSYIIDGLSNENGEKIKKALQNIPEIKSITINVQSGTVDLISSKDAELELKYACDIAKASFRIKINKKKNLF
ncbi:MAG: hypothetical protein PF693_00865 [Spirochaetia bacterium]|jgi:ribosomal protein L4|nr:hypothetical protein [Spirochaetia bacterium]